MDIRTIVPRLQILFGAAKHEVVAVAFIFLGLAIGTLAKYVGGADKTDSDIAQIYKSLDSIAAIQQTSYVGTDIYGNPISELAQGDTLLERENVYPSSMKKSLPQGQVNINTAGRTDLMTLPGVGESTANKIIEYRNRNPFKSIQDIMKVSGIGVKKFQKMRPYITTGNENDSLKLQSGPPSSEKPKKTIETNPKININTASKAQLESLPGIGPSIAQKIIDYRSASPFQSIEDIKNVSGIGVKKFEKIAPFIVVR